MPTEKIAINPSTINSLSQVIQSELERLFPNANHQEFLYFEFTEGNEVYIYNHFGSQLCSFPKLMRTLNNTTSASFNHFAKDNIWDILYHCRH